MRAIRRHDLSPRVEMLPLIDVIFLLLTFFIYSMVLMVDAQVLPVRLTPLAIGAPPTAGDIQTVTIDRDGKFSFNRVPVNGVELDLRLAELGGDPNHPTLYLAMEQTGNVDRGPLFVQLIERTKRAGITNIAIVGSSVPDVRSEP